MIANDFVKMLAVAIPTDEVLAALGIAGIEATQIRETYVCIEKAGESGAIGSPDLLIALVDRWDASRVQIGMLQFADQPYQQTEGIRVGVVEIDPLIVLASCEVVVVDVDTPRHVMWHVASSGAALLDALAIAVPFLTRRLINDIDCDDVKSATTEARQCACAAGGDRYYTFYSMLLGAES